MEEEHEDEEGIVEFSQAQFDQVGIKIGKAERKNIGQGLKVNGVVDVPPHGKISINLPYGGFLKATQMLSGSKVKKGQLIAVVQNPDFIQFQQKYQEGLARRQYLKSEYERQEGLFSDNVASEKKYEVAKSDYKSNEVQIHALEEKLKLIGFNIAKIAEGKTTSFVNIYAPVSGFVKEVYTNVGRYIKPQDVIMDITNAEDLHVELSVYENDIPKVKDGQRIRFTVANSPNQIREAEIFLIGKNVREDRSVTVHGHLESIEDDLLPGMYISANIITGLNEVWSVPEEAIVRFQGKHFVYSYAGEKLEVGEKVHQFEIIEVEKGASEHGYTQIGLVEKADTALESYNLVLQGAFYILSKSKNSGEGGHAH